MPAQTTRRPAVRALATLLAATGFLVVPAVTSAADEPSGSRRDLTSDATPTAAHPDAAVPYRRAPLARASSLSARLPNASCVLGRWAFVDQRGVLTGSANFQVRVYDRDGGADADDLLATGLTNGTGNFHLCFESTDTNGGGQEAYVEFISANDAWRVRDSPAGNHNYAFTSPVVELADPGGWNFGTLQPPNPAHHRALHAYHSLNKLFLWQADVNGVAMDNPFETRQMVLNWTPTSTDGTYYSPAGNDIHLAASDPDSEHVTIHEAAHALMDALYDDAYPETPNCTPHPTYSHTSSGCAWAEGWADWVAVRVLNDPVFRWPDGTSVDLETPTWGSHPTTGSTVEGWVAGSLIDLSDHTNENYWDRYGEGGATAATEEIYWTLALKQVSDSPGEYFLADRPGEGNTGYYARSAFFQNTIDFEYRDPLVSGQLLLRPSVAQDPTVHDFVYTDNAAHWGGVAIRPSGGDNFLRLLNLEQTFSYGSSVFTGSVINYVLVDGRRAPGTYYPQVGWPAGFTGSGYAIEEYSGSATANLGTSTGTLGSSDLIVPHDFTAVGGASSIRVVPSAGLDIEILAHEVVNGSIQDRHDASAVGNSGGAGQAESLQHLWGNERGHHTLVVLNKGGSGTYTIYHDDARGAHTRSVVIDGGAATTTDTTVDLAVSATAYFTTVTDMQISTDGVFDTEPWIPYATSASATLTSEPPGPKTVSVRFRNAGGGVSAAATDTITYVATCDGRTATITGSGTITGTAGDDVIVGSSGPDAISGLGGNDIICSLAGNDVVNDGPGADRVFAGAGNDVGYQPGTADPGDVLDGGDGTDKVSYASRSAAVHLSPDGGDDDGAIGEGDVLTTTVENLVGGSGNDVLLGSSANNRLFGNAGDDTLFSGDGNDYLTGGGGSDTLDGEDGNDLIVAGDGADVVEEGPAPNGRDLVKGGAGDDEISYGDRLTAVAIRLNGVATSGADGESDKLLGFERGTGGSAGDTIVGHTTSDTLVGNAGNDTISGSAGNDTIIGGFGPDVLHGNSGNDALNSQDGIGGNDSVNGGAGTDSAVTDPGDPRISIP